jgi:hypothetical protein
MASIDALALALEGVCACSEVFRLHSAVLAPQAFLGVCIKHRNDEVLHNLSGQLGCNMLNTHQWIAFTSTATSAWLTSVSHLATRCKLRLPSYALTSLHLVQVFVKAVVLIEKRVDQNS